MKTGNPVALDPKILRVVSFRHHDMTPGVEAFGKISNITDARMTPQDMPALPSLPATVLNASGHESFPGCGGREL